MSEVTSIEEVASIGEEASKSNDNCNVCQAWGEQRLPNGFVVMKIQHENVVKEHAKLHEHFHRRTLKFNHVRKTFAPGEIDDNRLQAVIDDRFKAKTFVDFKNRIVKAANVISFASSVLEELLLKSLAGGDEQDQHLDYDKSHVEKCVQSGKRAMPALLQSSMA